MKRIGLLLLFCGLAAGGAEIGEIAPRLVSGPMLSGNRVDFEQAAGKKIRVLHFWKTESADCASSVAEVNSWITRYKDKAVFLSVGAGLPEELRKESHWKEFRCPVMADALLRNTLAYLENLKLLPADAVIGADGKLLWVGASAALPQVLDEVIAGKFDQKAAVEADRFNRAMSQAMRDKDYRKALALVRERQKAVPEDLMLIVGEANILAGPCKDGKAALQVLDGALKKHPRFFGFYHTRIRVLQLSGNPQDPQILEVYRQIAGVFGDKPELLLSLAGSLMKQRAGSFHLLSVYALASAAYKSKALKAGEERGLAASTLARCYYLMGMVDRALIYQAEAAECLKKTRESRNVQMDLAFYRNAAAAAAEVRRMEKK